MILRKQTTGTSREVSLSGGENAACTGACSRNHQLLREHSHHSLVELLRIGRRNQHRKARNSSVKQFPSRAVNPLPFLPSPSHPKSLEGSLVSIPSRLSSHTIHNPPGGNISTRFPFGFAYIPSKGIAVFLFTAEPFKNLLDINLRFSYIRGIPWDLLSPAVFQPYLRSHCCPEAEDREQRTVG